MEPTPFTPLPSPAEMAEWDRASIHEFGIREEMLMENASREALHVLHEEFGSCAGKSVLLFMGSGNNGADAAALGRHLHDAGARVLVLHTRPLGTCKGAAGYHVRLARRTGVQFMLLRQHTVRSLPEPWQHPDCIVDGILGTGFKGALRPDTLALVHWINEQRSRSFIFALDIPSGLNGLTGAASPVAVRAHATVTFEAAKTGLHMPGATAFTGRLRARPIGIPGTVREAHPASCELLDTSVAGLLPVQRDDMHKGTSGHVLILGGSRGMTGAPVLAAQGALRGGAGYVCIAAPKQLLATMTSGMPDVLTSPLGTGGTWDDISKESLVEAVQRATALVAGPGMGRTAGALAILKTLLALPGRPPMVLDADALYLLAHHPELKEHLTKDDILTPHPGEAALLAGTTIAEVQSDRLATARRFALEYPCIVILKGAGTLISCPDAPLVLSPFAVPQLAVAGSGDVLAGLTASLLAQGLDARNAACLGTYLHGLAGSLLQTEFPCRGNTAQDIAAALIAAKKELATCLPPAI
ncbi:MAG: NAD(P)H-hydrate dehydratase [Halodesulfovibrio sp.]